MARKLEVTGLNKQFGDLQVLQNIDVAVERGEFIAVVGPSGCGKTTFLRIVAGLEPATSLPRIVTGLKSRNFPTPIDAVAVVTLPSIAGEPGTGSLEGYRRRLSFRIRSRANSGSLPIAQGLVIQG